jgi:hypothetical protein
MSIKRPALSEYTHHSRISKVQSCHKLRQCIFLSPNRILFSITPVIKVTAENVALGKVNFSNGILKQPDFSLTAVCHCGQDTYSLATGLNAAVLVTLLERQLVCLRILKMQVWLERYLFKRKVIFSTSMKYLSQRMWMGRGGKKWRRGSQNKICMMTGA